MHPLATFTIVRNETTFFWPWLMHAMTELSPSDIYVLDHGSTGDAREQLHELLDIYKFNYIPVHHEMAYDTVWLSKITSTFQKLLLQSYLAVLFSAVDEIVTPTPESGETLRSMASRLASNMIWYHRCNAFEVTHRVDEEPALDLNKPWLEQRQWWYHPLCYSKPLLSCIPLNWKPGWFGAYNVPEKHHVTRELLLIHLHKMDYKLAVERHQQVSTQPWNPEDRLHGPLRHNLLEDPEKLSRWLLSDADDSGRYAVTHQIPQSVKDKIILCSK